MTSLKTKDFQINQEIFCEDFYQKIDEIAVFRIAEKTQKNLLILMHKIIEIIIKQFINSDIKNIFYAIMKILSNKGFNAAGLY